MYACNVIEGADVKSLAKKRTASEAKLLDIVPQRQRVTGGVSLHDKSIIEVLCKY